MTCINNSTTQWSIFKEALITSKLVLSLYLLVYYTFEYLYMHILLLHISQLHKLTTLILLRDEFFTLYSYISVEITQCF